jgi:hypothetical protein
MRKEKGESSGKGNSQTVKQKKQERIPTQSFVTNIAHQNSQK